MLVFIDETGDHDLQKIDPEYPVFGLGALLITEAEYTKMDAAIKLLKQEFFDKDTFILHSSELKRPTGHRSDKRNIIMLNPEIRRSFYESFDRRIVSAFDYKLVVCFIRKKPMADLYHFPANPYYFSFENLLNRIIRYGNSINTIFAEKRGSELDPELLAEYERLSKTGIHRYEADTVKARTSLRLIAKHENLNGLQIIDLLLACLTRHHMGKTEKMIGNDLNPYLITEKLACPPTFFPYKRRRNGQEDPPRSQ